jgi:hypothetical protein
MERSLLESFLLNFVHERLFRLLQERPVDGRLFGWRSVAASPARHGLQVPGSAGSGGHGTKAIEKGFQVSQPHFGVVETELSPIA